MEEIGNRRKLFPGGSRNTVGAKFAFPFSIDTDLAISVLAPCSSFLPLRAPSMHRAARRGRIVTRACAYVYPATFLAERRAT